MELDERGWLFQADALIRSQLNINPDTLTDPEWAHQVTMALWLEQRKKRTN